MYIILSTFLSLATLGTNPPETIEGSKASTETEVSSAESGHNAIIFTDINGI